MDRFQWRTEPNAIPIPACWEFTFRKLRFTKETKKGSARFYLDVYGMLIGVPWADR